MEALMRGLRAVGFSAGGGAVRSRPELIPYAALGAELDLAVGLRLRLSERCVRGKDLPGMAFKIALKRQLFDDFVQ
jgi:hypothetical protein